MKAKRPETCGDEAASENLSAKTFECLRCNECCRKPGFVFLQPEEEERIASFSDLSPFDFVNAYCELFDRRKLVLKKYLDETCVFLSASGCLIYPARPRQCRGFPQIWKTEPSLRYCADLVRRTNKFKAGCGAEEWGLKDAEMADKT